MKISRFAWLAALLAVAAVVGAVGLQPRPADAVVTGATKACASAGTQNQAQCVLQITDNALAVGNVYTITINGPAQFLQQLNPALPFATTSDNDCVATVTSFSATQIVVTISGNANCGQPVQNNTIDVTELVAVTGPGAVSQTVVGSGGTSGTVTAPATGLPAFVPGAPSSITKTCTTAAVPGQPAGTAVVGQPITCQVTVNYTTAPTTPQTGTATITGGTFSPGGGTTQTFTVPAGQTSFTFTETIVPTTVGVIPGQTIAIGGSTFTVPLGGIIQVVSPTQGFRAGTNFIIRCPSALNPSLSATPLLVPGEIAGTGAIAVGVLPAALICEALFVDNAGNAEAVAPGTIEVSTLSGSLVDLSGRLSTNLRIGCGDVSVVNLDNFTIDVNTCRGVRFGVLGVGVGFVEVRARYEPIGAAARAGITERETRATVGFIAPSVSLNLLLSPNPVAVNQNGTATLRFNRVFTFLGDVLIDPTTGIPIAINLGTALNGTVTFTTSNAAIAAFTGALTTTTGTVAGGAATVGVAGTVATASQATVRCGLETATVLPTVSPLSAFFGGCDQVQVGYRGVNPGTTVITATYVPDLPNAFGLTQPGGFTSFPGGAGNLSGLFNLATGIASNTVARTLEVVGVGPATTQRLVAGCNNVVAPANETVQQVAARVDPATAVISIWRQVPGTTQFQGAPIAGNVPAGVANLSSVNALDAIFICVNAAATYRLT